MICSLTEVTIASLRIHYCHQCNMIDVLLFRMFKVKKNFNSRFSLNFRTNVMLEMPHENQPITTHQSLNSISSSGTTQTQSRSELGSSLYGTQYHGAEAWWSVGEFLHQGITHQSVGLSLQGKGEEDTWDLSDSIADLYMEVSEREKQERRDTKGGGEPKEGRTEVDKKWLEKDTNNGFVRVFQPDSEQSKVFPCTLSTSAHKLCLQCGRPPNSMHIQLNGDIIRRLEPFDCPLAIQNEYLQNIGYKDIKKIQQMGLCADLSWLVKFYAGKGIGGLWLVYTCIRQLLC